MQFKALKVFCDVVSRKSFSRAADENSISQSGVSQIVHHLEERLGTKLIDRSKRPFVLTTAGEVFYDGCRPLVKQYFALEDNVKALQQGYSGRVTVASIYSVGLSHMNAFVQDFLSRYPQANVRLEYQHPDRVIELVETGEVDVGLLSYPQRGGDWEVIPWREEPMVLVCASDHHWAGRESVDVTELSGENLVGFDPDLRIRRELDRELSSLGVECHVVMEFDNIETLKRAVEIQAGLALLPEPTILREVQLGTLCVVPVNNLKIHRSLSIICRQRENLGRTAQRFIQLLQEAESTQSKDDCTSGATTAVARS